MSNVLLRLGYRPVYTSLLRTCVCVHSSGFIQQKELSVGSSSHATIPAKCRKSATFRPFTVRCQPSTGTCSSLPSEFLPISPSILPQTSSSLLRREFHQSSRHSKQHSRSLGLTLQDAVTACPEAWQPYMKLMRLDKPIGSWLLFLPCTFSITMASPAGCLPDPYLLTLFAVGSVLMRGAGCTINDMWDKDFDAKVARTRDRPLPSGMVSQFQALVFLGVQLSGALAILIKVGCIPLGASSLLLVATYPLMKRFTYWPQFFLGIAFNWGALFGWSAVQGSLDWGVVVPLYGSLIAWTLVYDTIYAHQDKEDDLIVGIKSTALKFGDETKYWLAGFASVMTSGLTVAGYMSDQTWPFYMGVTMVAAHLGRQIYTVDLNNPDDCGNKFRSNRNLGLVFWATLIAANLLKKPTQEAETETQTETQPETQPETQTT